MARKIYKRVGLKRDNNLGDVSNSTAALNNLLDTLVDDASSTFISDDLNAIRGIYSSGLTNSGYRQIIGSAAEFTDQNGISRTFLPRITYQNRLDKFKVFSGEPRLSGGNGLTAKYYRQEEVFENTQNIFIGSPFKIDNFWEAGNFNYTGKITPEAVNVNGGVEWEGYFVPTSTGQHQFIINSSACFTLDFQTQGYTTGIGTYTEISRVGLTSTFSASGSINTNTITLASAANTKFVGVGQSVSNVAIVSGTKVGGYDRTSGVITLTPPTGTTYAVTSNFSGNVVFSKTVGQDTQISYTSYILEAYQRYRIKFRYYIPQSIDAISVQRNINFDLTRPGGSVENLRYDSLYSLDYDFSQEAKGNFPTFVENSILFGGGTIGGTTNPNNYVRVTSSKKVDIKYQPKTSVSAITKSSTTASVVSGTNIMSITDTSNIEVGNYIFGTGITDGTRVNEIAINSFIVLSQNAISTSSGTYAFIDHRGFVKRATGSSSSGTITLSSGNTTSLTKDMVVIGTGYQSYTKITNVPTSTTLTITPSQSVGSTTLYFYQSKGLINNGLAEFCLPAQTKCLLVTADTPAGSTVIPVTDSSGVGNGWAVQGFQFASGTTVNGAPTSTTSITVSSPTIRNLVAGANFTVTSATGDRTLCCPPTDTSPPFNPTLDGLETVSDAPNLQITSGDVKFDALRAQISGANITAYSSSDVSGSRISIQTPAGTYKILCA